MAKAAKKVEKLTRPKCDELLPAAKRYRVTDETERSLKFVVEPRPPLKPGDEPTARKYWTVRYVIGGKNTEKVLGEYPGLLPEKARDEARKTRVAVKSDKIDPAQADREERRLGREARQARRDAASAPVQTFAWLAELYLKASEQGVFYRGRDRKAATTIAKERQYLRRHLLPRIGARSLVEIKRAELTGHLDEIVKESGCGAGRGRSAANTCLEVMQAVFAYGRHKDLIENNPCLELKRFRTAPRDKVADDVALRELWRELERAKKAERPQGYASAAALQVSLLTLQRRGEVARIRREDVDFAKALWTIPAENKKERRKGLVPLSPWAAEILGEALKRSNGDWAFPEAAPKKKADGADKTDHDKADAKTHLQPRTMTRFLARLRKWRPSEGLKASNPEAYRDGLARAERLKALKDITPHDLRRTGRTRLTGEELQIDELTAERVLNHAVGSRQQNAYDWNTYVAAKRDALEAWAGELRRIVSG